MDRFYEGLDDEEIERRKAEAALNKERLDAKAFKVCVHAIDTQSGDGSQKVRANKDADVYTCFCCSLLSQLAGSEADIHLTKGTFVRKGPKVSAPGLTYAEAAKQIDDAVKAGTAGRADNYASSFVGASKLATGTLFSRSCACEIDF